MGAERERGGRELIDFGDDSVWEEEQGEVEQGEEQEGGEVLSLDLGWRRDGERLGKRKAMVFISSAGSPSKSWRFHGIGQTEREKRVLVYVAG